MPGPDKYYYKPFASSVLLAVGYVGFFIIVQFILYKAGIIHTMPTADNLVAWDARWYEDMVNYGSRYWAETNSSAGFFPLFPLIWKVFGFNGWTASLFNLACFSIGFGIFTMLYPVKTYA